MRRTTLIATAALAALALAGCEQPPNSPQFDAPQWDLPSVDAPQSDTPTGADPDEYGPLLPATPDGAGEAPEPELPDEVTAYCHGGDIVDYKPKTPEAHARAQGICSDQQVYDEFGFTEPDPRGPSGTDPFDGDGGQFHQDMQNWLDEYTAAN